jgi:predicted nucleic acid-binding protein
VIAADTSTWIAFLQAEEAEDTQLLDKALADRQVVMIPVVLTELHSDPELAADVAETLADIPMVLIEPGYWRRAGTLRARVLSRGRRARLGDALIAQCCIDHDLLLITRDKDFRAFAATAKLNFIL